MNMKGRKTRTIFAGLPGLKLSAEMILYIKNMVCNRCRMVVEGVFRDAGLEPLRTDLGEVLIRETQLGSEQKQSLDSGLQQAGFELIDSRKSRQIEQIKTMVIGWVHHSDEQPQQKYSELISSALHQEYSSLSRLFSETEGITIEQYIINQKIERVKELMIYDERSLSQIAFDLGYSSVAHLSAQFKKVTGMTPTYFKGLQDKGRKPLDEVGNHK
jgi:AraC-like DNA-binding protein